MCIWQPRPYPIRESYAYAYFTSYSLRISRRALVKFSIETRIEIVRWAPQVSLKGLLYIYGCSRVRGCYVICRWSAHKLCSLHLTHREFRFPVKKFSSHTLHIWSRRSKSHCIALHYLSDYLHEVCKYTNCDWTSPWSSSPTCLHVAARPNVGEKYLLFPY